MQTTGVSSRWVFEGQLTIRLLTPWALTIRLFTPWALTIGLFTPWAFDHGSTEKNTFIRIMRIAYVWPTVPVPFISSRPRLT